MKKSVLLAASLWLCGCLGMPDGVRPVSNFKPQDYLGKWYEFARLDHAFERGLTRVTAEYSLREDGGVAVVNRGFSSEDNEWKQAEGKAYFVGDTSEAYLKVSFFGPFYVSCVIFELDRDSYGHALVSGPNRDYLWLLSRTPTLDPGIIDRFVDTAHRLGFDTRELIFPQQL